MKPKILRTIRFGKDTYGPGQERELLARGISRNELKDLQDRAIISGFIAPEKVERVIADSGPRNGVDVPLKDLKEFLAECHDANQVEQWATEDIRKTAHAMYEQRLAELDADHRDREARDKSVKETQAKRKSGGGKGEAKKKKPVRKIRDGQFEDSEDHHEGKRAW